MAQKFSLAYKMKVVACMLDQGMSIRQGCETFGISATTLRRWMRDYRETHLHNMLDGNKPITAEQCRIRTLEARVRLLEVALFSCLIPNPSCAP